MSELSLSGATRLFGDMKVSESQPRRLIIAIDFGTTYSGIAYCFPDQREATPNSVLNWPGSRGVTAPKIPTIVKYGVNGDSDFEWGSLVKNQNGSIIGIKLMLDPNQALPWHVPRNSFRMDIKSLPKAPEAIAADFLREMHSHAMEQIATKIPQAALDLFVKEYIMSVPAVWSDAAKNATLKAATDAGISPVTLIKEPEAAALYTIRRLDTTLDPNDVIVICDAGGGTVDLVSYEIEATSPTLQLKEIVPGTGAMVGSVALNLRFKAAVQEIIPAYKWEVFKSSRAMTQASIQFEEEIKKTFNGDLDEEYYVNFPRAGLDDDPKKNLESNEWRMTGTDVANIFEPVMVDILQLIRDQVQSVRLKSKSVKAIFLVGGFGSNQYLRVRVEQAHPDIRVVQPDDAWAAIAKGAALSRMPDNAVVTSVSAVRHYGIQSASLFDPIIDEGQARLTHFRDGRIRAYRMSWHIKTGDSIKKSQKIRVSLHCELPENFNSGSHSLKSILYDCEDRVAPVHMSEGRKIKQNCVLISRFDGIPTSKLIRMVGKSSSALTFGGVQGLQTEEPYWLAEFDLVISFESALMKFSLEFDGEIMGSVEAQFDQ